MATRSSSKKGGKKSPQRAAAPVPKTGSPILITGGSLTIVSDYAFNYTYDPVRRKHVYTCQENKKTSEVRHKAKGGAQKFKDNPSKGEFIIELDY
jgi:hypothetical protein